MVLTAHAQIRMKERQGLSKKASSRMVEKILQDGIPHRRTKGQLNKYISKCWHSNKKANNIRLYGENIYIFCNDTLITTFNLPQNLKKNLSKMIIPEGK